VVVWRKPDSGPMSQLIWAPELHEIDGKWYIYFAATHTHDLDALGCSSTACSRSSAPTAIR
jgi:GH43 family beta-xylosidase